MENKRKRMYICKKCNKEFYKPRKIYKLNSYRDVCPNCGSKRFSIKEEVVKPLEESIKASKEPTLNIMSSELRKIKRLNACITELKNLVRDWEVYCEEWKKICVELKEVVDSLIAESGTDEQSKIFEDIWLERQRQIKLWGLETDDVNTRNDWVAYICHYVFQGAYNSHGEHSPESFRAALVKTAALCVAAMETINRKKGLPSTVLEVKENNRAVSGVEKG